MIIFLGILPTHINHHRGIHLHIYMKFIVLYIVIIGTLNVFITYFWAVDICRTVILKALSDINVLCSIAPIRAFIGIYILYNNINLFDALLVI